MVGAGELDRRITIQQRGTAVDADGQQSTTWTDVCTVWAQIRPASGREVAIGQAMQSAVSHMVCIRYRAGITAAMRAVHVGTVLDINSVIDPDTKQTWLHLMCTQGLNQG